jgi:hypothetical protein
MQIEAVTQAATDREIMFEQEIARRRRIPRTPDEDDSMTAIADDDSSPGRDSGAGGIRAATVTMGPALAFDTLLAASALGLAVDAIAKPSTSRAVGLLRTAAATGSLVAWGYFLGVRPWHRAWGASERELRSALPGDGVIPRPNGESTRAITIDAPPSCIWPWIAQLGAGRGGFYSYDWLENLAGLDIHSSDAILPEYQQIVPGDEIPFGNGVGVPVIRVDHERTLLLGASIDLETGLPLVPDESKRQRFISMTWAFVLRPIDSTSTRLITRFRFEQSPRGLGASLYPLMIELPHFVMERRMLRGIRDRAERLFSDGPR